MRRKAITNKQMCIGANSIPTEQNTFIGYEVPKDLVKKSNVSTYGGIVVELVPDIAGWPEKNLSDDKTYWAFGVNQITLVNNSLMETE